MENNNSTNNKQRQNNNMNAVNKMAQTANKMNDKVQEAKTAANLAKNASTGNYIGAAKDAVNLLKNKKTRRKMIMSMLINILIPIIVVALLAGILLSVINAIGDVIETIVQAIADFFTSIGNWFIKLFKNDELVIVINEKKFEQMKEALKQQGIDAEEAGLTDESLKVFLLAQYKTQYPRDVVIKIEVSDDEEKRLKNKNGFSFEFSNEDVDGESVRCIKTKGCIKVYRPEINDRDKELRYIEMEELEKFEDGDKDFNSVKEKYSIDDQGNIVIPQETKEVEVKGRWHTEELLNLQTDELEEEEEDFNIEDMGNLDLSVWQKYYMLARAKENSNLSDSESSEFDVSEISVSSEPYLKSIAYRPVISYYTMPFEFLTLLTAYSQNPEFGIAVANLINNDSYIEMEIREAYKTQEERRISQRRECVDINYRYGRDLTMPNTSPNDRIWIDYTEDNNGNPPNILSLEDSERSRTRIWDTNRYNLRRQYPRVRRDATITFEKEEKVFVREANTWLVNKKGTCSIHSNGIHLDSNEGTNPQISNTREEQLAPYRITNRVNEQDYEENCNNSLSQLAIHDRAFGRFLDFTNYMPREDNVSHFTTSSAEVFEKWLLTIGTSSQHDYEQEFREHAFNNWRDRITESFNMIEVDPTDPNTRISSNTDLALDLYNRHRTNLDRLINDYRNQFDTNGQMVNENLGLHVSYHIIPDYYHSYFEDAQQRIAWYVRDSEFRESTPEVHDNTDGFINLLVKTSGRYQEPIYYEMDSGKKNAPIEDYLSSPDMLFKVIASNPITARFENTMRYILYKITNKDYGYTDFDFGVYGLGSTTGHVIGDTVEEKVWYTLRAAGFSEYAVAGVMGNIAHEAYPLFDPSSVELDDSGNRRTDDAAGVGLCAWTGKPGQRQLLEDYAERKGKPWQDADVQIEFLLTQLNNGHGPAEGIAGSIGENGYYFNSSRTKWMDADSPEEAAKQFMRLV